MSTHDWPKMTRFATLAAFCALSLNLGQANAAHAGSITDKVKGAFASTGEALKKTAQAGGAAVVYTSKAVGTTAGAVAGATGELVTGSAKALETSSEATVNATGELLGMHHKQAGKVDPSADSNAAKTASAAPRPTTNATADGATSAATPGVPAVVKQVVPARAAAVQAPLPQVQQKSFTTAAKTTLAPLPKGNSTSVSSAVARGTINGTEPAQSQAQAQANPATASGAASAAIRQAAKASQKDVQVVAPVKQAQVKPVKQPKVQAQPQVQAPAPVARMPLSPPGPAVDNSNSALDAAAMEVVRAQTGQSAVGAASGKGASSPKISKHTREEMLKASSVKPGQDASAMSAAQELQALAPAQISNDITEGTRISAPVEDSYVAPSWNQQQPVTTSAAFAQQYSLHTTPLKPAPSPGQPPQAK